MPFYGILSSHWWIPIVVVIVMGHITNVCVTLFLHRSQTHRSVTFHAIASIAMRIWLWPAAVRGSW